MHHRRERARKPRKPLRFEEEPCSWTVHVTVRDSIERELMCTPLCHVDSPGARAHTKAGSFLRLFDMLFQILDPWGCDSTPQTSKFIKYTIVSLAILYFLPIKRVPVSAPRALLLSYPSHRYMRCLLYKPSAFLYTPCIAMCVAPCKPLPPP